MGGEARAWGGGVKESEGVQETSLVLAAVAEGRPWSVVACHCLHHVGH